MTSKIMFPKIICSLVVLIGFIGLNVTATAQHSSVDSVVTNLYESISFAENGSPDYERFKSLFVNGARLMSVRDTTSISLTPAEYEQNMNRQRSSGNIIAFEERELHRRTERFGNLVHVFSTYEIDLKTSEGTDSTRGINSIQLIKQNGSWKAASIIWYEENEDNPLPEKYLPTAKN